MLTKLKTIFKYAILTFIGVSLAFLYSYIIHQNFTPETIIVFVVLYAYLVVFIKFLIRLFK